MNSKHSVLDSEQSWNFQQSSREMGKGKGEGERNLEGNSKSFMGKGGRGDCWLDLQGAKLFLLPLLLS